MMIFNYRAILTLLHEKKKLFLVSYAGGPKISYVQIKRLIHITASFL